jgi:hypothetical protein
VLYPSPVLSVSVQRVSCTVKAVFPNMASSLSQKHEAHPSVSPRLIDAAPKVIKI